MRNYLWTVDFDNNCRMYVSASTILMAIRNAVWEYNKNMDGSLKSSNITSVRLGRYDD